MKTLKTLFFQEFEPEEHVDNVMDGDSTFEIIFEGIRFFLDQQLRSNALISDSMLSPIPSPTIHVVQSFGGLELGSGRFRQTRSIVQHSKI